MNGEGFAFFCWHRLMYPNDMECISLLCWSNWYGRHR